MKCRDEFPDWNILRDEALTIAQNHGWHDEDLSNRHYLMLILTEISEIVEADRKNRHADKKAFETDTMRALRDMHLANDAYSTYENSCFNSYIKDTIEDELSDVIIRCLDLSGLRNIDLSELPCDDPQIVECIVNQELTLVSFDFATMVTRCISDEDDLKEYHFKYFMFYVLEYCKYRNIDIEWFVKHKIEYNKTRAYKHGKKY